MSDERTPDQRAADDAVQAALEQHMTAYSIDLTDRPTVLVDWVFAYAGAAWAEDGDKLTRYGTYLGHDTAAYSGMGLVNCLQIFLDGNYAHDVEEED